MGGTTHPGDGVPTPGRRTDLAVAPPAPGGKQPPCRDGDRLGEPAQNPWKAHPATPRPRVPPGQTCRFGSRCPGRVAAARSAPPRPSGWA